MSLSSFLLGGDASKSNDKSIDTGLNDLFKSTVVAPAATASAVKPPTAFIGKKDRKRKDAPNDVVSSSKSSKRTKGHKSTDTVATPTEEKSVRAKAKATKIVKPEVESSEVSEKQDQKPEEDEEAVAGPSSSPIRPVPPPDDEEDSDEEGDPSKLVHETLLQGNSSKSASKKKYVPAEETAEQRNARTIFIGNVPIEAVTSRPLQKQLKRHILTFVPTAKIESVRFRSIAFSKPTASTSTSESSSKDRQHNRDRAASWRESKGLVDEDADKGKTFLTQNDKKRIAFIKQELHKEVDSVNAYIVFAHPSPTTDDKRSTVMDPYEAAKVAIKEADGSMFHEHSLRVDTAVKGKSKGKVAELEGVEITEDPKATIFVGNLDFACKEEDVRAFFEKLMVEEKGAPGENGEGSSAKQEEDEKESEDENEDEEADGGEKTHTAATSLKAWVKRVRVIRDKDTLLGKGFGYVQFTDRSCVDEILALEEPRLKFAKRKLRVQRCKTLPGASKSIKPASTNKPSTSANSKTNKPERHQRSAPTPVSIPKGDPTLGSKIAGLSKEERKKAKSTDADRVARRLAKKKAKVLADKGVKSRDGGKDRERVRKRPAKEGSGVPEKKKAKTGRVRSGNAIAKMNRKK